MGDVLPVLVCGAGPTGLALALELARFRVPFRLIDRATVGAQHSQALAIQARTLELLEATTVTDRLLNRARLVDHVRIYSGTQPLLDVPFAGMPTRYSFLAMVPQVETEAAMRDVLEAYDVPVERGVELAALDQTEHGTVVELRGAGGVEHVEVAYVAGCDGAHSTLRHLLGVSFEGHALPERFALADAVLATDLPADTLRIALGSDGGVVALFPLRSEWRIIVESPEPPPESPDRASMQAALDALGVPARVGPISWAAAYHVQQRRAQRYQIGRTLLLGDAAHIHSPVGGQGMNTGIGDAINLAWKLALVVHGEAAAPLLDTYAIEREAVGRALLAATDYGNRLAFNANTAVRALRNAVVPVAAHLGLVRDRLRENVAQLRVAYPRSPLSVNGSPARSGMRAGMRVRGFRPAGYRPQTIVVHPHDADAALTLVLRPDGYAGYVADGAHAHGATAYLKNVIGLHDPTRTRDRR